MTDEWEEHSGAFKNEADLEEELDEEGKNVEDVEKEHFEE